MPSFEKNNRFGENYVINLTSVDFEPENKETSLSEIDTTIFIIQDVVGVLYGESEHFCQS